MQRPRAFELEPRGSHGDGLLLGERALALAPRLLGSDAERVRLRLLTAGLAPPARAALAAFLEAGREGPQELELPRTALADLAGDHEDVSVLAATVAAGERPRALPRLLGVVNVSPDSFSDGRAHERPEQAVERGLKLLTEGAEILDVGGESTRPGAREVPPDEELERVVPVIAGLARETSAPISVDTTKSVVAHAALDAGASVINDVSAGLFDPEMFALAAERDAELLLMHMQGTPRNMQAAPHYDDVVSEVTHHLRERAHVAWKAGVPIPRIALDPGIGFGKRLRDNTELLSSLSELRSLGLPLVVGVSRKSFLGELSGEERADRRDVETVAAVALADARGADVHRVHDVAAARRALRVAAGLRRSSR